MATDFELLDAWKGGDKAAGNALFQRHFDSVCRFFRSEGGRGGRRSAIERRDTYYAVELLGLALDALIQRLFAAHRTYFRAPKRIDAQLAALPLGVDRRRVTDAIDLVVTRPNDRASLQTKRARLLLLAQLVDAEVRDA